MSFLSSIAQAVTSYQARTSDRWARQVVSTLPQNVRDIFNQAAKDKLVRGFSDESSFYRKPQTSDVAVLKTKNEISILFYVGGISERRVEIVDWECSLDGKQTSLLEIKDVVSRVLIKGSSSWEIDEITLNSDFAKCIKSIEGNEHSFSGKTLSSSELLFKEITGGVHADFKVISKADFDKRDYMIAHIKVVDLPRDEGDRLAVLGNGIGMNDWKRPIPMRLVLCVNETWHLTIRGTRETGEFKVAFLKSDDKTCRLEAREPRKFKDIQNPGGQELYPCEFEALEATL